MSPMALYVIPFVVLGLTIVLILKFVILKPPMGSPPEEYCWAGREDVPGACCTGCAHRDECPRRTDDGTSGHDPREEPCKARERAE